MHIDMSPCDSDKQTVTICYDGETERDNDEAVTCKQGGTGDEGRSSATVSERADSDTDAESVYS